MPDFKKIKTIFKHELFYMLRDKTTLFMMVLLPIIIYPLISVASVYMFATSAARVKKTPARITLCRENLDLSNAVSEFFKKNECNYSIDYKKMATEEVRAAIAAGKLSVYIEFPDDFEKKISAAGTSSVSIKYDMANDRSTLAVSETINAVGFYKSRMIKANITKLSLNPNYFNPFDIQRKNMASPSQVGDSFLARILPMLIIMFATLGAFYPAIDVTAMEKERGTLETLLLAPVSSFDIMAGKFLAVFVMTMLSIIINLFSIGLTLTHGIFLIKNAAMFSTMREAINFSISLYSIFVMFVFMTPMACIMSAIMMQVAIFARNFKEAQNYMTPLLLVFILPPMVSMLPGYELTPKMALIPIINLTLLLKGMLTGHVSFIPAAVTFAVNLAFSLAALALAAFTFSSEAVLFRPSEDMGVLCFWRFTKLKPNQELSVLAIFFLLQLIALYYIGSVFEFMAPNMKIGILLTQALLIFLPAFFFIKSAHGDFLKYIEFKIVDKGAFFYAACVAVCGFGFTALLSILQSFVIKPPDAFLKEMNSLMKVNGAGEFFLNIVFIALLPALCEEIMFRGMLLPALYNKYGRFGGALLCGTAFGLFHFSIYRFLPTAFIGFYLSLLKIHTGSIIPSMFCHFINNSLIITITSLEASAGRGFSPGGAMAVTLALMACFTLFPFLIKRMVIPEEDIIPAGAKTKNASEDENDAEDDAENVKRNGDE